MKGSSMIWREEVLAYWSILIRNLCKSLKKDRQHTAVPGEPNTSRILVQEVTAIQIGPAVGENCMQHAWTEECFFVEVLGLQHIVIRRAKQQLHKLNK
jgi:hypothetical protein